MPLLAMAVFKETPCSAKASSFREYEIERFPVTINGRYKYVPFPLTFI